MFSPFVRTVTASPFWLPLPDAGVTSSHEGGLTYQGPEANTTSWAEPPPLGNDRLSRSTEMVPPGPCAMVTVAVLPAAVNVTVPWRMSCERFSVTVMATV